MCTLVLPWFNRHSRIVLEATTIFYLILQLIITQTIEVLYHQPFKHHYNIFGVSSGIALALLVMGLFKQASKGIPVNTPIKFHKMVTKPSQATILKVK